MRAWAQLSFKRSLTFRSGTCHCMTHIYNQYMDREESINYQGDNKEAWLCICGNDTSSDGFFPCDTNGNEMVPAEGWDDLYVCGRCGRIINQHSLKVIGQNTGFRRLS